MIGSYLSFFLYLRSDFFFLFFLQDDADDCSFFFVYRYDEENNVYIQAQEKKVCPQDINFWFIIFGVILGMLQVVYVHVHVHVHVLALSVGKFSDEFPTDLF